MVDVATGLRGINAACNEHQSRPVATNGWLWVAEAHKCYGRRGYTGITLWCSVCCLRAVLGFFKMHHYPGARDQRRGTNKGPSG